MDSKRLLHIDRIPKDEELQEIFEGCINSEVIFCIHRASYLLSTLYLDFQRVIENFLNRKSVNALTLARFDRLWMRNILMNFRRLIEARPVSQLFETKDSPYRNKAALVCGAGPSLSYDMERIKSLRKKFILIAVDTALKALSQKGIDPDIVLCVDPQALSRHYIEGYEGKAIFVVDPASSYLSLTLLPPEKIFYFWSPFVLADLLFQFLEIEPGKLAFGGSVSTNAYDLAFRMGCDPIFLAGHDLAFTENLAHVRGAALEEALLYKWNRLFGAELHNYRQLRALPTRYLEADKGERTSHLSTNDKLVIFHQWFERRLQSDLKAGKKAYKFSPRGLRLGKVGLYKEGTSLSEFADLSFSPPPPEPKKPQKKESLSSVDLYKGFASKLKDLAEDFFAYSLKLEEGLSLAKKMRALIKGKERSAYLKLLPEMEKIDKEVMKAKKSSTLASHILQGLILQMKSKSGSIEKGETSEEELAQSSVELYTGLLEASATYQRALQRNAKFFEKKNC